MELITSFLTAKLFAYVGGSIGVFVLAWVFKRVPNERIKNYVGRLFYGLGVSATLGLSKWQYSSKFWEKIIEPWLIDFIDNLVGHSVKEFIRGLRSDNNKDGK